MDIAFKTQIVADAYQYWLDKRQPSRLPARGNIDPLEMKSFLPNLLLLDVLRDPLDFRYRLIGTEAAAHMMRDYTGSLMSALAHQKPPSRVWDNCETVVRTGEPLYPQTPYIGPKKEIVDAEDLLMPLSEDGTVVNMLLIVVAYIKKPHF